MMCKIVVVVLFSGLCARYVLAEVTGEDASNFVGRGLDAKGMLQSIANNFMSRGFYTPSAAGSGSQVISLNVTNLLVLLLLKALIFAAGSIGAGTWKGGLARSIDGEEKILTDEEILMFLSYLTGTPGDNGCLQSVACRQPEQAVKYVAAGDMLLKTSKILNLNPDRSYEYVLRELEQAARLGLANQDCRRYLCDSNDYSKPSGTGTPGDNGCLQSVACRQPEQAVKYVAAGDMLLKTSKILNLNPDRSYEYVLRELEQAARLGLANQDCRRYLCDSSDYSKPSGTGS